VHVHQQRTGTKLGAAGPAIFAPAMKRSLLLLLLPLLLPLTLSAQEEGRTRREQEKIQAKQEQQEKKDAQAAEKELRQRHLALQDKATRKRMKQHDRRADKHGTGRHRDPWIKRVFRKH